MGAMWLRAGRRLRSDFRRQLGEIHSVGDDMQDSGEIGSLQWTWRLLDVQDVSGMGGDE